VPRGYLGEALFSRALYAELRGSSTALGAPDNYVQLRVETERVFDLRPKWHLFLRGQLGASLISDTGDLPGTERFFAGGDRSVRGFGYNDLGPRDVNGINVGGKHQLTGAVELIRDLPRNFGVALFVDAGNAFDRFGDPLQYFGRPRRAAAPAGRDHRHRRRAAAHQPALQGRDARPALRRVPGFDDPSGPRLHLNFSPKL
jgi:translocation and assembly module TamA